MCCKLTFVPEINKPVNTWCPKCEIGEGCKEYETRPDSCKSYRCIWLSGGLSLDMRPDKCKVLFERLPSGKTYLALIDPDRLDSWKEPIVRSTIDDLISANKTVVVNVKPIQYLLPKGRKPEEVVEDIMSTAKMYGLL